jgi:putative oxidoreductase
MSTSASFGVLVVRLVGLVFAAHGAQKLLGWFGGPGVQKQTAMFHALGLRPARVHALSAGSFELGGGLLLALGLVTPLAALAVTATMTTAIMMVHWPKGFFNHQGGYEFNLVLIFASVGLASIGPGNWSLDHAVGIGMHGLGWAVAAAALGVLGGVIVAVSSRRMAAREAVASPAS